MKTKEDKSVFLECFGDTPQLRVLDFLIGNHFFDFPNPSKALNISKGTPRTTVLL